MRSFAEPAFCRAGWPRKRNEVVFVPLVTKSVCLRHSVHTIQFHVSARGRKSFSGIVVCCDSPVVASGYPVSARQQKSRQTHANPYHSHCRPFRAAAIPFSVHDTGIPDPRCLRYQRTSHACPPIIRSQCLETKYPTPDAQTHSVLHRTRAGLRSSIEMHIESSFLAACPQRISD